MADLTHSLSVDIGGTFTDFSLLSLETGELSVHKTLTDPAQPARALMEGAAEVLAAAGAEFENLSVVVHSTTLATNAIIERKGAKTALLTTKGFRDVLEIGREQIYDLYDLQAKLPAPLVPRRFRREVAERVTAGGRVLQRPDEAEVASVVSELVREGVEALGVSLLHAYKDPSNEQAVKAVLTERFPGLSVSLSSEVAPVINEYERTSTTVADGYIKPSVARYLTDVAEQLWSAGYPGRLLVMHSAGGVMSGEAAGEHPVRLLESGPAAGALAASFYGELLAQPDLISFDMGGTTAKVCVIEGGSPLVTNTIEVDRVDRFKRGSGIPIVIPVLDLIEIGSGGGSIAWVDSLGLIKVGPQSAGATPGPACYGHGGTDPTVTDANLVLGYLDPGYFLGGRMSLDANAARRAVATLGNQLGLSETEAAWGIYSVVTESMAAAARIHIIERNKDPRNYAIIGFGGAGPAHAGQVARVLGVKQVVVPLGAGVTSALGCLTAPLSFEEVRSLPGLLSSTDRDGINAMFVEMERLGTEMLRDSGVAHEHVEFVRSADMRLVGQIHEINVPVPAEWLDSAGLSGIEEGFHQIYQELYSRKNLSIPIEVQNWRVLARATQPPVRLGERVPQPGSNTAEALRRMRQVYFHSIGGYLACPVYARYLLRAGAVLAGPAIIEERESTTVVGPKDSVAVDQWLNLIIDVG